MECFRIDESGYTGFDLLNPEQRFQGATAIAISDEEAARLIREHFPKLQAPELKYHSLARRPAYHRPLLELQRVVLAQHKCVTYVCDKRYLLLLMFLDYAVEHLAPKLTSQPRCLPRALCQGHREESHTAFRWEASRGSAWLS